MEIKYAAHYSLMLLLLLLFMQLKDEAVSLVDVVAPPDFILKSPIGASDGQVGL